MYQIILHTWYQEIPNKIQKETYNNLTFESLEDALYTLSENYKQILNDFPVTSLEIKLINKSKKNNLLYPSL